MFFSNYVLFDKEVKKTKRYTLFFFIRTSKFSFEAERS